MRTFAYLGNSLEGGTYRVYEALRDGLAPHGWEGHFVNENCLGTQLPENEPEILAKLAQHLGRFDAVIANVFISVRLMNVVRFLPESTARIMVVHNITHATYLAAQALRDHVHHTVGVSRRIGEDLVGRYGFRSDRTSTILNAVPDTMFIRRDETTPGSGIALLSLGRIEERSKRIFLLPRILQHLDPASYHLTVAGDGPDRGELLRRLDAAGITYKAPGRIGRSDLPTVLREHDVFLFPSRFEGMGIALAEAMAAGLVPLAATIPGVTDRIISEGVSGYLHPQGDAERASARLRQLISEPKRLKDMQTASQARAMDLFSMDRMSAAYARCLEGALADDPIPRASMRDWSPPRALGPGWRGLMPTGLRRWIADRILYR